MQAVSEKNILRAENLTCVRGDRKLFESLSVTLFHGQLLFVEGKNGSGKTTLLRTISGLSQPDAGNVLWNHQHIATLAEEYHSKLIYIGHQASLKDDLTAVENLQFLVSLSGLHVSGAQAIEALTALGIARCADLPARVLSQGQKRRVALARLCLASTSLWILDEPFTALDVGTVSLLTQRIEQFVHSGGMVVFTSHQAPAFNSSIVVRVNLG